MIWVKDYKCTLDWGWFTDVPTAHFWEYVRLRANSYDEMFMGRIIPRGSFATSVSHMAIETGLSEKQIRLAISKLEKTGEITVERTNRFTVINIVKYALYQDSSSLEGKQEDTPRCIPTSEQRESPRENEGETIIDIKSNRSKNIKKEIYKERKPTIEEVRSYCKERNNGVDADKWFNYYSANGWKVGKNPMKDWKACVRTWERNTPKEEKTTRYEVPW